MPATFDALFQAATGNAPYAYQRRLAGAVEGPAPSGPFPCASQLISIPTGLGKTAAVVLAWLWNRVVLGREDWPRRLVYCLPMRTLVEQTRDEVPKWLSNVLEQSRSGILPLSESSETGLRWLLDHSPIILMGGEDAGEWDIHPERPAILIGTQDMLLSRALNRGYGVSRARWPMHFGLLNNDALWVLDETQLMGVGVRTSAQLEGLRRKLGTALGCATWWASATLDSRLLLTPDHRTLPASLALGADDLKNDNVHQRIEAVKRLAVLPFVLVSDSAKVVDPYIDQLAAAVVARHQKDTTTIVILNRVDRAKDLYAALDKLAKKSPLPPRLLVHSRFRPLERAPLSKQIKEPGTKIIIATQAIEAGVDISARTLITELAPWSSLVQRFGRCNRKGEFNSTGGADIFWINLEAEDPKGATSLALPYTPDQLATARTLLRQAESTGVSPVALNKLSTDEPLSETHILRRKDLVDLFDTTPDLAGLDIDVGRYIRDGEERDVQVYWRALAPDAPPPDDIAPQRQELVRVSLYSPTGFKKFAEKNKNEKAHIWLWSVLDGEWQRLRPDRVSPGQIYLIDSTLGGYSTALGWTGEKSKEPFPLFTTKDQAPITPRDGQGTDEESQRLKTVTDPWQSIETHTAHVLAATNEILAALPAATPWADTLRTAARWHDVGKAHACFQSFITHGRDVPAKFKSAFIAKAPWRSGVRHSRPHFRHELASALAWLQAGHAADPIFENLVAYLIATHHGKIRLSLRAMPGEESPPETSADTPPLYARGVWHGDRLPSDPTKQLAIDGVPSAPLTLDLTCMQMGDQDGRPSWTSRMLTLRDADNLGLFRLAWLETILRASDAKGSKR
ncbi:MAG: CRISPR-associated endonuclease Cas3'' [Opitutaceae bacterium]|jgi:CRISPR-associated endonuclease/helicase Cas3